MVLEKYSEKWKGIFLRVVFLVEESFRGAVGLGWTYGQLSIKENVSGG